MDENGEFETLKKDLESKSQQIENLKSQIEHHKTLTQPLNSKEKSQPQISDNDLVPKSVSPPISYRPLAKLPQTFVEKNPNLNPVADNTRPTQMYFTAIPTSTMNFVPKSNNIKGDINNIEGLVKNLHQQIEDLQRKLRITTELCAEQDLKYQTSFKDMELKLRRAVATRDELLTLRQSESNNQQQLINHLQQALDKLEQNKTQAEENRLKLTQTLAQMENQNISLKDENDKYQKCFENIVAVLLPDIRKLTPKDDQHSEVGTEHVPKLLEKILTLNNKERELLDFQLKTAIGKIEESNKINEERISYEKKLVETQYKESGSIFASKIEAKDKQLEKMKEEMERLLQTLEEEKENRDREITMLQNAAKESEENHKKSLETLHNEKEALTTKIMYLEQNVEKDKAMKCKLEDEIVMLKEKLSKAADNVGAANQMAENLENHNRELTTDIQALRTTLLSLRTSSEIENVHLQNQISSKEEQIQNLRNRENELTQKITDITANVETRVKDEEKLRYQKEVKEISDVIENHKSAVDKMKWDIDKKDTIIEQKDEELIELHNALLLLQKDSEELLTQHKECKNIVSMKDSKIISLQTDIENVKFMLTESNRNVQYIEGLLNDANKTIEATNKHAADLEKEKIELLQNVEKSNFKSSFIQQEWDKIINAVNNKNEEILRLQKEKKRIAHKLKEKHELLITAENECKSKNTELNEVKHNYTKLENIYTKLNKKYTELEKELGDIHTKKTALEVVVEQQEDAKEKEIMKLVQHLHGSENDLLLLKKLLKSHKLSDSKALKVATVTQQVVTKQRSQLDSLKTKLQWMKEALDVSEQARREVQEQIKNEGEYSKRVKEQLMQLEEKNHQLKLYLTLCRQEATELQRTLEKAAIKYADVYSLVEKQEQFLKKEREQHSSEMEKLKRLSLLHASKKVDFSAGLPRNTPSATQNVGDDLRHLLNDVKQLLSTTLENVNNRTDKNIDDVISDNFKLIHLKELPSKGFHVNGTPTDKVSRENLIIVTPASGKNTQKLNEYLERHSSDAKDLSSLLGQIETDLANHSTQHTVIQSSSEPMFASSPKEVQNLDKELLIVKHDQQSEWTDDSATTFTDAMSMAGHNVNNLDDISKIPLSTDHNAVQRLQEKLQSLKKMGSDLTSNNKELATMMEKHSKKLKKLKEQTDQGL